MYQYQEYPKFLYHKTEGAKIVQSKEELEACGDEWQQKPFELLTDIEVTNSVAEDEILPIDEESPKVKKSKVKK